jgi:hypothetical protein
VEKRRSNSQYFKGKKLESKIFNQLNIKKVKSTKIILKNNKQKKGKVGKKEKSIWKKKEKRRNLEKKDEKINDKVKKRKEECTVD